MEWSTSPNFTLSPQTTTALVTTLRASASLTEELLQGGYDYVLTARFQSDPLELHFSKYRQMSGGRFLVSLLDVQHSERILAIDKLLKEEINFWEEDLSPTNEKESESIAAINEEVSSMLAEILECNLSDDSKEVAFTIAGLIAKKLSAKTKKCPNCVQRMIASGADITHCGYLSILSRGGLTTPAPILAEFVCRAFSIMDAISPILKKHILSIFVRPVAKSILNRILEQAQFSCEKHTTMVRKWTVRTIVNIFYSNDQKITNEQRRKDQHIHPRSSCSRFERTNISCNISNNVPPDEKGLQTTKCARSTKSNF